MSVSDINLSRLRWQCRRGMRELDELLTQYLDQQYATADEDEKTALQGVLELPDPELMSYLLQQQPCPPELAVVIDKILLRADP